MISKNPYWHLKSDCLTDAEPVDSQVTWTITECSSETITIFASMLPDKSWVYGYLVRWANGRTSVKRPSPELGKFRTQREAKLYAIGFMLQYLDCFTESTRLDIKKAESALLQSNLEF